MAPPSRNRICVAAVNIPPKYGGGGRAACRYARYFAAQGEDVLFVTNTPSPDPIEGVELVSVNAPGWYFSSRIPGIPWAIPGLKHIFDPILFARLWRILDPTQIGVVHCKSGQWFPQLVLTVARMRGIPTIIETTLLDGDDPVYIRSQRFGSLKLKMYKQADHVVNVSPVLYQRCEQAGIAPDKIELIPYSVNISKFSPSTEDEKSGLRKGLGLQKFRQVILSVGILTPRKNTAEVLEIFRQLADAWPDSCLAIVGPTNKNAENEQYTQHIKNLARQYDIQERVIIPGTVPNVEEWMKASDVFLFASDQEGLANVYLEAISSGLPVVTRKIEGITDYIFDGSGNGFLYDDPALAIEIVERLLSDPTERRAVSERARGTAIEKFSEDAVMLKFRSLYDKMGLPSAKSLEDAPVAEKRKIFGIGLSRTGSKTLNDCLTELGYRSHFVVADDDLEALLPQFDAFTHLPLVEKYRELDRRFPESKFILTIRERESWLQSCEYRISTLAANFSAATCELLRHVYGTDTFDRQMFIAAYNEYHREVKQHFNGRDNALLILDICGGEGFEKLCPFLGKDVPLQAFPHHLQNSRLELQKPRHRIKRFLRRHLKTKQIKGYLRQMFGR